jgi:hypothetical protein
MLPISLLLAVASGQAVQSHSPVAVEQVAPRAARHGTGLEQSIHISAVRGARSVTAGKEVAREAVPAAVSQQVVDACIKAQTEDRVAPEGVDCATALRRTAPAAPTAASAEGSLLELFGQRADITGSPVTSEVGSANADAVARQLSSGDVQAMTGSGAAGAVGRDRAGAPPTTSPRQ